MENIMDRVAFNWINEEILPDGKVAYIGGSGCGQQSLPTGPQRLPNFLTGGSVTIALVDTLVKTHENVILPTKPSNYQTNDSIP